MRRFVRDWRFSTRSEEKSAVMTTFEVEEKRMK